MPWSIKQVTRRQGSSRDLAQISAAEPRCNCSESARRHDGRVDDLQMYSPEIGTGYVMMFSVAEDARSRLHGTTLGELLQGRITRLSDRKPPSWSIG